jgi:hypothetical protein
MDPGPLPQDPSWSYDWERELTAVTSARVREALEARGVTLCTFADLTAARLDPKRQGAPDRRP